MIPGHLQQCGALESRVHPTAKRFLQAGGHLGSARSVSAGATTSDEPGRIRYLGDALTRFEHGNTPRCYVGQTRKAIAGLRLLGVALGGGEQLDTVCTSTTRSTRYSMVCGSSRSPMASVQARARPRVNSALDSQQYS